eukprot:gene1768-biopygen2648
MWLEHRWSHTERRDDDDVAPPAAGFGVVPPVEHGGDADKPFKNVFATGTVGGGAGGEDAAGGKVAASSPVAASWPVAAKLGGKDAAGRGGMAAMLAEHGRTRDTGHRTQESERRAQDPERRAQLNANAAGGAMAASRHGGKAGGENNGKETPEPFEPTRASANPAEAGWSRLKPAVAALSRPAPASAACDAAKRLRRRGRRRRRPARAASLREEVAVAGPLSWMGAVAGLSAGRRSGPLPPRAPAGVEGPLPPRAPAGVEGPLPPRAPAGVEAEAAQADRRPALPRRAEEAVPPRGGAALPGGGGVGGRGPQRRRGGCLASFLRYSLLYLNYLFLTGPDLAKTGFAGGTIRSVSEDPPWLVTIFISPAARNPRLLAATGRASWRRLATEAALRERTTRAQTSCGAGKWDSRTQRSSGFGTVGIRHNGNLNCRKHTHDYLMDQGPFFMGLPKGRKDRKEVGKRRTEHGDREHRPATFIVPVGHNEWARSPAAAPPPARVPILPQKEGERMEQKMEQVEQRMEQRVEQRMKQRVEQRIEQRMEHTCGQAAAGGGA